MEVIICDHFRCSPLSILSSYHSSFSPSTRYHLSLPSCSSSSSFRLKPSSSSSSLSSSRMEDTQETHNQGRSKFIDFPFVSSAQKNLMVDLVSKFENRLQSQLLPCILPPDVQYYQSQTGTAQASLHIRSASNDSPVNFPFSTSSISIQSFIFFPLVFVFLPNVVLTCFLAVDGFFKQVLAFERDRSTVLRIRYAIYYHVRIRY